MSKTTEATGRTLEEAKRAAADALGVSIDDLAFEVLEQAAKGLFAKGNYKVRATAAATADAGEGEPAAKKKPSRATKTEKVEKPAKVEKPTKTTRPAKAKADADADAEEPTGDSSGEESEETAAPVIASDADGKVARELVQGLFESAGLSIDVEVGSLNGKYVNLALSGQDVGVLLGSKSPGLDSAQYLSNAMMTRVNPGGVRVTLDAKRYREQRASALTAEAVAIATQVVEMKQEAVLDALPAHERRIIHQALLEFEGVETYSEGEEPNRRVIISPSKG
jgi:spoIIIJ-associated protein